MGLNVADIARLRKSTGSAMQLCKVALEDAEGDYEKAIQLLRERGDAKARKLSSRISSDGRIFGSISSEKDCAVLVDIASQSDFTSLNQDFINFTEAVAKVALASRIQKIEQLLEEQFSSGLSVEEKRKEISAKFGENVYFRSYQILEGENLDFYVHGGKVGGIVSLQKANSELSHDLALQVVASEPSYIDPNEIPAETIAKERAIFEKQVIAMGKPANVLGRIVDGKIAKYFQEVCLMKQPFLKDPSKSVEALLKESGENRVIAFIRFQLGNEPVAAGNFL